MQADLATTIASVIRDISATTKALRLYPASSPIPRDSASAAVEALNAAFEQLPVLSLEITKAGFAVAGAPIEHATASTDLAGMLQSHGIAEVSFLPGCDIEDLVTFLSAVIREAAEVRAEGGLGVLLATAGVTSVSVSDVHLTVVDAALPEEGEDVDEFLRRLAHDPDKLGTWLATATAGDPTTLQESLLELSRSVGATGQGGLLDALSQAFLGQESDGKDALMGLAMEEGPVRDLTGDVFSRLGSNDIAESVCDGVYGKNMLSLSTAMTSLPIGERFGAIMSQVRELLPEYGHAAKELEFLEHMIVARKETVPESALADVDPSYEDLAARTTIAEEELDAARQHVAGSDEWARRRTVTTLVGLLDQQKDFELYCQTLDSLAGMVPRLLEAGDLPLARMALAQIADREASADLPWPEVADRLRDARTRATSGRAMADLLAAVEADPENVASARELLQVAGDRASQDLVEAALNDRERDGLAVAERILGRRMSDLLPGAAARAQWFQAAVIARRLADAADPRSAQALQALAKRPDEQTRREVAKGLGSSSNPSVLGHLGALLKDPSPEVSITAARALAATGASGAAGIVSGRLDELDVDNKDFATARELIGALAKMKDPAANEALERLAHRRALIKRGHFAEVQDLARRALALRKGGGAS